MIKRVLIPLSDIFDNEKIDLNGRKYNELASGVTLDYVFDTELKAAINISSDSSELKRLSTNVMVKDSLKNYCTANKLDPAKMTTKIGNKNALLAKFNVSGDTTNLRTMAKNNLAYYRSLPEIKNVYEVQILFNPINIVAKEKDISKFNNKNANIRHHCNCPDYFWHAWQNAVDYDEAIYEFNKIHYIAKKPRADTESTERTICKHILAVINQLKTTNLEVRVVKTFKQGSKTEIVAVVDETLKGFMAEFDNCLQRYVTDKTPVILDNVIADAKSALLYVSHDIRNYKLLSADKSDLEKRVNSYLDLINELASDYYDLPKVLVNTENDSNTISTLTDIRHCLTNVINHEKSDNKLLNIYIAGVMQAVDLSIKQEIINSKTKAINSVQSNTIYSLVLPIIGSIMNIANTDIYDISSIPKLVEYYNICEKELSINKSEFTKVCIALAFNFNSAYIDSIMKLLKNKANKKQFDNFSTVKLKNRPELVKCLKILEYLVSQKNISQTLMNMKYTETDILDNILADTRTIINPLSAIKKQIDFDIISQSLNKLQNSSEYRELCRSSENTDIKSFENILTTLDITVGIEYMQHILHYASAHIKTNINFNERYAKYIYAIPLLNFFELSYALTPTKVTPEHRKDTRSIRREVLSSNALIKSIHAIANNDTLTDIEKNIFSILNNVLIFNTIGKEGVDTTDSISTYNLLSSNKLISDVFNNVTNIVLVDSRGNNINKRMQNIVYRNVTKLEFVKVDLDNTIKYITSSLIYHNRDVAEVEKLQDNIKNYHIIIDAKSILDKWIASAEITLKDSIFEKYSLREVTAKYSENIIRMFNNEYLDPNILQKFKNISEYTNFNSKILAAEIKAKIYNATLLSTEMYRTFNQTELVNRYINQKEITHEISLFKNNYIKNLIGQEFKQYITSMNTENIITVKYSALILMNKLFNIPTIIPISINNNRAVNLTVINNILKRANSLSEKFITKIKNWIVCFKLTYKEKLEQAIALNSHISAYNFGNINSAQESLISDIMSRLINSIYTDDATYCANIIVAMNTALLGSAKIDNLLYSKYIVDLRIIVAKLRDTEWLINQRTLISKILEDDAVVEISEKNKWQLTTDEQKILNVIKKIIELITNVSDITDNVAIQYVKSAITKNSRGRKSDNNMLLFFDLSLSAFDAVADSESHRVSIADIFDPALKTVDNSSRTGLVTLVADMIMYDLSKDKTFPLSSILYIDERIKTLSINANIDNILTPIKTNNNLIISSNNKKLIADIVIGPDILSVIHAMKSLSNLFAVSKNDRGEEQYMLKNNLLSSQLLAFATDTTSMFTNILSKLRVFINSKKTVQTIISSVTNMIDKANISGLYYLNTFDVEKVTIVLLAAFIYLKMDNAKEVTNTKILNMIDTNFRYTGSEKNLNKTKYFNNYKSAEVNIRINYYKLYFKNVIFQKMTTSNAVNSIVANAWFDDRYIAPSEKEFKLKYISQIDTTVTSQRSKLLTKYMTNILDKTMNDNLVEVYNETIIISAIIEKISNEVTLDNINNYFDKNDAVYYDKAKSLIEYMTINSYDKLKDIETDCLEINANLQKLCIFFSPRNEVNKKNIDSEELNKILIELLGKNTNNLLTTGLSILKDDIVVKINDIANYLSDTFINKTAEKISTINAEVVKKSGLKTLNMVEYILDTLFDNKIDNIYVNLNRYIIDINKINNDLNARTVIKLLNQYTYNHDLVRITSALENLVDNFKKYSTTGILKESNKLADLLNISIFNNMDSTNKFTISYDRNKSFIDAITDNIAYNNFEDIKTIDDINKLWQPISMLVSELVDAAKDQSSYSADMLGIGVECFSSIEVIYANSKFAVKQLDNINSMYKYNVLITQQLKILLTDEFIVLASELIDESTINNFIVSAKTLIKILI